MRYVILLSVLLVLGTTVSGNSKARPLLVRLPNGLIQGHRQGEFAAYESIPYAMPPVGDLRLERPQPYTIQWKKPFKAREAPALCMQWSQMIDGEDKLIGQEDCLTVSIYTTRGMKHNLPVVVLIHGGFFMYGGASQMGHEHFGGQDVVVVKVNYRLGPLGFVSTGDSELPGNLGLKDQRLALDFIAENIEKFGGDPDKMLLMGVDAGGASTHLHLLQQGSKKYSLKAAASISGNALNSWVVQEGAPRRAFELGRTVGCGLETSSSRLKDCLKTKDGSEIVRAVFAFLVLDYIPFSPFGPVVEPSGVEQAFLTQHPIELIRNGKFQSIPWLASYTSENGNYNAALFLKIQFNKKELLTELNDRWSDLGPHILFYRDSIKKLSQQDDFSRDIRQLYMGNQIFSAESYVDMQRMFTDMLFKKATLESIHEHRLWNKSPVYGYIYDNPSKRGLGHFLSKRDKLQLGSGHSDDFSLVFNHTLYPVEQDNDKVILSNFVTMLKGFASTGTLAYGDCDFQDNANTEGPLRFIRIRGTKCIAESIQKE